MYRGHVPSVCLYLCASPHSHTTARTRMQLGGMVGVPPSCALLGECEICALVSLLWQHSVECEMSASACTRAMPGLTCARTLHEINGRTLASPAMEHWGTCPRDLFEFTLELHKV